MLVAFLVVAALAVGLLGLTLLGTAASWIPLAESSRPPEELRPERAPFPKPATASPEAEAA